MRYLLVLTGVLTMMGCATFQAGAPEGAVDVIAHRGASAYRPENTLASFNYARELHADWFELDCTLSRDYAVIVMHDDTLDRTTDGKGKIKDFTLPELKAFEAGSWFAPEYQGEPIPTLGQALDVAKNHMGVYVEIKNSADDGAIMKDILEATKDVPVRTADTDAMIMAKIEHSLSRNLPLTRNVIELVRQRRMEKQVVIQSFSPIVCAIALIEAPEIRTELLAAKDDKHPERWDDYLRWAKLLNVAGFNTNNGSLTKGLLDGFHADGRTVAVWTVDEPDDMRRLADWGVDAIITNKPDVCLQVLDEMGKHWKKPWWDKRAPRPIGH